MHSYCYKFTEDSHSRLCMLGDQLIALHSTFLSDNVPLVPVWSQDLLWDCIIYWGQRHLSGSKGPVFYLKNFAGCGLSTHQSRWQIQLWWFVFTFINKPPATPTAIAMTMQLQSNQTADYPRACEDYESWHILPSFLAFLPGWQQLCCVDNMGSGFDAVNLPVWFSPRNLGARFQTDSTDTHSPFDW